MQCKKCAREHDSRLVARIVDGKPGIYAQVHCDHLSSMDELLDFKCKGFVKKEASQ